MSTETGQIESVKDFASTPQGQQQRWTAELKAAQADREDFDKEGARAIDKYLGKDSLANLFHANVDTVLSIVYGQIPSVDVSRRFADAGDDQARVASEALERLLQTDIERDDDGFRSALRYALQDWKLPGLGVLWFRYELETETVPGKPAMTGIDPETGDEIELAPEVPEQERKTWEDVETDYVNWQDFLWSPARTWHEVEWVARRAEMTRDQLNERFGEERAKAIPLRAKEREAAKDTHQSVKDAWKRAEVWEIWCKSNKTVYWFSFGMNEIIESKPDHLGLEGFFPCPRPIVANVATRKFMPKPDFALAEALYEEVDRLSKRIKNLQECAKYRWVYDKTNTGLKRLFDEATEGEGIPVDNWAGFVAGGGLKGAMDSVPIDAIVVSIAQLNEQRNATIALLYQVTGLSDIVRGQSAGRATATEQSIKAQFASTRLQTQQDDVATFATESQRIRAEIVAKHFDPQTIITRSNLERTRDAPLAAAAVALIKDQFADFRVDVKADSIALRDYAALKSERIETIGALGQLFQQTLPFAQTFPPFAPFILSVGAWLIAATKGAQTLEADFDTFRAQADQAVQQAMAPKPPQPDPKMEAVKAKAQADVQGAQIDMAGKAMDFQVKRAEHGMEMEKIAAETQAERVKAALGPMPGGDGNG